MSNGLIASQGLLPAAAAVGAVVAARYWRLDISATQDGSTAIVGDMEMRGTVGGADLTTATDAPTLASASSSFSDFYLPKNGFDDDASNVWRTVSGGMPAWLQWDFGSGVTAAIYEISLAIGTGAFNASCMPKEFTLSRSDDAVTFTTVFVAPTQAAWAELETRIFAI